MKNMPSPGSISFRRQLARGWAAIVLSFFCASGAEGVDAIRVEGQPLAANVRRLAEALEFLGAPLPRETAVPLDAAAREADAPRLQQLLDPHAALVVAIEDDANIEVSRGPAPIVLQQAGFTPVLVKIVNRATVKTPLAVSSPQSGPVYGGVAELSMKRQQQEVLRSNENRGPPGERFLHLEMFASPPMTPRLSGLAVEYAIALLYSSVAGTRQATIGFSLESAPEAAKPASVRRAPAFP
jgi:hypothetical protein